MEERMLRIEGDTIVDAFRNTVRRIPDRPALRRRVGSRWEMLTWADYGRAVSEVTAGLSRAGNRSRPAGRHLLQQPGRVAPGRLRRHWPTAA